MTMPDPSDDIRRLVAEASAMKTKPLPGMASLAWNHPGVVAYETDSEKEWENDQRRQYVLSRLAEKYPKGEGLHPSMALEVYRYGKGQLKDIDSPYHYRGWFTPGAPAYDALHGMSLFPALAYSASAMAANAVDPDAPFDPDARKKFNTAVNSLGAYVPEAVGLVPKGTPTLGNAAEQRRLLRGSAPWNVQPDQWNAINDEQANRDVGDMYIDGKQHWMKTGVPEVPAMFLGAMADSVLDPYSGWAGAVKHARQGKRALASLGLAKEYGWGQGAASLGALGKAAYPDSDN